MWFLAALLFMNTYQTMAVLASTVGYHEETVRKWVWQYIDYMALLPNVSQYLPAFKDIDTSSESDTEPPSKQQRLIGKTD